MIFFKYTTQPKILLFLKTVIWIISYFIVYITLLQCRRWVFIFTAISFVNFWPYFHFCGSFLQNLSLYWRVLISSLAYFFLWICSIFRVKIIIKHFFATCMSVVTIFIEHAFTKIYFAQKDIFIILFSYDNFFFLILCAFFFAELNSMCLYRWSNAISWGQFNESHLTLCNPTYHPEFEFKPLWMTHLLIRVFFFGKLISWNWNVRVQNKLVNQSGLKLSFFYYYYYLL